MNGREPMIENKRFVRPDISINKLVLVGVIIILSVIFQIFNSNFLTVGNISNISRQASTLAITAVGQLFVIIVGCIDLSQGSIIGVVSVFSANMDLKYGLLITCLLTFILCIIIGLFHGILISKFRIPAFIVTMGSMTMLRGAAYLYTNGMPVSGMQGAFTKIGIDGVLGLPYPFLIASIVFLLGYIILKHTVIGREMYCVGGNEEASLLSGIKTHISKIFAYCVSAVLTGIGAIVLTSRVAVGQPTLGDGFQLQSVAAVVIGGASMRGGEGGIFGTVMGVILISIIGNGLNLLRVSSFIQMMVNGMIIILAVGLDMMQKDKGK